MWDGLVHHALFAASVASRSHLMYGKWMKLIELHSCQVGPMLCTANTSHLLVRITNAPVPRMHLSLEACAWAAVPSLLPAGRRLDLLPRDRLLPLLQAACLHPHTPPLLIGAEAQQCAGADRG